MNLHFLIIPASILLLASCSSRKEDEVLTSPLAAPAEEEELAYIPTYSKSVLAGWPKGRSLDKHDTSRVRLDEQVHAYHVGRLPSHDRQEMHEAHTVYRLEQNARWDTRLPATPMQSRGVLLGIIEPSRNEVPKTTLIEQERQSLLAKSRQLEITMTRLNGLQGQLEKKLAAFDETEKKARDLELEIARTLAEKNEAKAALKAAEERIRELDARERLRVNSSNQSLLK
ncbi:hypothetical protein [Brevifollis gellanilyticus]|uniref:Uncharacterized protein n=1 Tax=Brevifollis gellanilyticus TaxID=748831 RepID=A0A512M5T3_9BACT|nr:hypothetical protein [Brevifollis gellanilyticus]GEP42095.1 hypothetical protein BGE01nite_13860 [Brevifollis gellanilyticus]